MSVEGFEGVWVIVGLGMLDEGEDWVVWDEIGARVCGE